MHNNTILFLVFLLPVLLALLISNMTEEQKENTHQLKSAWLESQGFTWNDVLENEQGEYVLEEGEDGMEKRYLDDVITQE